MFKSGLFASSSLLAVAVLGFASSASATDFVQNDGAVCGALTPDPNGGCNANPSDFQALGSFGVGGSINVTGTMGTYIPAGGTTYTSRDLDWYKFTLTADCKIDVTLNRSNDGGEVVLFIGQTASCPAAPFYGQAIPSFTTVSYFLTAGEYYVIATTSFEVDAANPANACVDYTLGVEITAGDSGCVGASLPCDVAHATPGCDDWSCCNAVCAADPSCCSNDWDISCVNNGAVAICGYFIYSCNDSNPANDCLTSATVLPLNTVVAFDNTNANTDGPSTQVTGAASGVARDLWWMTQAPANGQLTWVVTHPGVDTVLELYGPFDTAVVANPQTEIPPAFIGQVDGGGTAPGGEGVTLIDAESQKYYLIRVGSFVEPTVSFGPGTIEATFAGVVYTTGPQKFIVTSAGANQNLGLSSGAISAASKQRWLARPFTVPTPDAGGNAWDVTQLVVKGFQPAGVVNDTLHYTIWKRTNFNKPVDGDQLFSGSVPYPVPFDDGLDSAATASHAINIDPPVTLAPGNYYLTVYASNPNDPAAGGSVFSNFAWFIYSPNGIPMIDQSIATGVFSWRSVTFPTPGFAVYQALTGNSVQAGDDPNQLYSNAFNVFGTPTTIASACPADLNGDGSVGAADLAILLGQWGGAGTGDLNGDGSVGASDLAILLGAWGACP